MRNQQDTEIPDFDISNRVARIYWNKVNIDGSYSADFVEFDIAEDRANIISLIIASKYPLDSEIANINNSGKSYRDYLAFREQAKILADSWLLYSGQILEMPVVVPQTISMRQARLQLHKDNLLSTVNIAIASIEDPYIRGIVEIEFEYATEIEITWSWVVSLGAALGLDLDRLFIEASKL